MSWLRRLGFSLFTEPDEYGERKISLGRLAFTLIFVHSCVVWSLGHDVVEGELSTLWILLGYVAGTKAIDAVRAFRK